MTEYIPIRYRPGGYLSEDGQDYLREQWSTEGHDRECYYRRECLTCGREVFGRMPTVKYCSYRCMMDAHYARRRDRAAAVREANRARVCGVCGSTFAATRADARYCSPKCRQKAYRDRNTPANTPRTPRHKPAE